MKTLKTLITVLVLNAAFISVTLAENRNLELKKKKIISQIENPFSEKESLKLVKELEELKKNEELTFLTQNFEKATLQRNEKLASKLHNSIQKLNLNGRKGVTK